MSVSDNKAQAIFLAAIEQHGSEQWSAFVDEASGGDAQLRERVERLLRAHAELGSFHEASQAALTSIVENQVHESPGTLIGPYKLLEQIGEGGFGTVFMAEQLEPVRREVALKVIKPGMDSKQVVARFEAERQALAMMDHPNIAKVLGAGATDAGRPYFVMELVRGIPITDYCDQAVFSVRLRLQLFVQVCRGVQHAHTKGVIHRDLKPGNVLVTSHDGVSVPYIIDFGVAKALGQQLSERSVHTGFAQMIGTPLYMSPEQAELNQMGVDTRSDIYSLGVLLYELLTGATPFDKERLRAVDFDEMRRILREEEPPRPSTRLSTLGAALSTVSERRGVDPRILTQTLAGELDWILLKALEKDRNRRYESASSFAADVERYLNDEPVLACPPSVGYRVRKFARRNKRALATAALLAVMLLGTVGGVAGMAGAWISDRAAQEAETRRDREAREAEAEHKRLAAGQAVGEDLREADLLQEQERWPEMLQVLERARSRLAAAGSTPLRERVEQRRKDVAMVTQLEDACFHTLHSRELPLDHEAADLAYRTAFSGYGVDFESLDSQKAANRIRASAILAQLEAALAEWAGIKDGMRAGSGDALFNIAQLADNEPWRRKLRDPKIRNNRAELERLANADDVLAQPPPNLLILARALDREKGRTFAVALLRRAQQRYPANFWVNFWLGTYLMDADSTREAAISYLRAALALRPQSAPVYYNLGMALQMQGNFSEAIDAYKNAIALQLDFYPAYLNLSVVCIDQKKWSQAVDYAQKAIDLRRGDPRGYDNLGSALAGQRKLQQAVAAYEKAIDIQHDYAPAFYNLGITLMEMEPKKIQEADRAFRKAIDCRHDYAEAHRNLGLALMEQEETLKAEAAFSKAINIRPDFALAYGDLGAALERQNKLSKAEAAYRKAIALQANDATAYCNLGVVLLRQKAPVDAESASRNAIRLKADHPAAYRNLAQALRDQGRFIEALAALKKARQLGDSDPQIGRWTDQAELLVKLDAKLLQLMKIETKGLNAVESLNLAMFCQYDKKLYISSVSFYQEAFLAKPEMADNLNKGHRLRAARAAVMASGSQNKDAGTIIAADRSAMRKQAHDWLQADLDSWSQQLQRKQVGAAIAMATVLPKMQTDRDLAGVRDEKELAKVPEAERESWQKLWAEVEMLRKQAADMFKATLPLSGTVTTKERQPFHDMTLYAGKTYVIDLESTAFDTFLVLLDAKGKEVDHNDDIEEGVNLNSRLIFTPKTDGVYRILASAFQNSGVGPYTLTIREFVK